MSSSAVAPPMTPLHDTTTTLSNSPFSKDQDTKTTSAPISSQAQKITMSAPVLDTTAARDAVVDESPISPARANPELEKRLATRPDAQDLKNRHILLDTTAAPCVSAPLCAGHCLTMMRATPGRCSRSSSSSSARRSPTASRGGSSTGRSARSSSSVPPSALPGEEPG
jgi:hypothetical protein